MRLSVIGCGYLGAVHAAAMASIGHDVVGIDVDERKIAIARPRAKRRSSSRGCPRSSPRASLRVVCGSRPTWPRRTARTCTSSASAPRSRRTAMPPT